MLMTAKNGSTRSKTCSSDISSTTDFTWADLVSSPGLRGERQRLGLLETEINEKYILKSLILPRSKHHSQKEPVNMLCRGIITVCSEIHTKNTSAVGSRFEMVRFTTIHFYDPCRVGPSTPVFWCITVVTQASFLYLVRF
jgi:hypothetical protein